jgi:flagella basal body P-ring formation protein FlgA
MNSGMFKTSVKTSTPAQGLMQILCLMVFGLWASIQPQLAVAQTIVPAEAMRLQVSQWLSQTHRVNAKEVVFAPLDERLKVQACQKPLMVDHPFASKETVRVRCPEPVWQLYLQVSLPASSNLAAVAPNPGASGVNAGQTAKTMLITRRLLQRGTILQADMLEEVQASPGNADTQLLTKLKDAQQAELTRDMAAGQPLRISDIRRALMVKQGQTVMMSVGNSTDFQITVRMEALQDGRMGEQVKLKNPESGRQVSGVVTGPNTAKGL